MNFGQDFDPMPFRQWMTMDSITAGGAMLSESETIQNLMQARSRIAAAAWLLTRDYHASEDCFQNVVLKAMTKEVSFPNQAALISWAFVVILRDAMDWLDRRGRKVAVLDENVLAILDRHQQSQELWQVDLPLDRFRALYPQLNDKSSGLQLIDVYALTVQDDVGLEILGVKLISPESN